MGSVAPSPRPLVRIALLVLVAAPSVVIACGGADEATPSTTVTTRLLVETSTTTGTTIPADFVATAEDFVNINDMTAVRGLFIDNRVGLLDEALAVANDRDGGGEYPVGTIIQLIPQEAMVKRGPGFSPDFGDWEFFELAVTPEGTEILKRGGREVVNRFGQFSCADCHAKAEPQFDFVCEQDHGCDELPVGEDVFIALQMGDPRPRASVAPD
jgi:hypothetical protein